MTSAAEPTPAPVPGAAGPADVHLTADGSDRKSNRASRLRDGLIGGGPWLLIDRVNELFARSSECIYPSP